MPRYSIEFRAVPATDGTATFDEFPEGPVEVMGRIGSRTAVARGSSKADARNLVTLQFWE